MQSLLLPEAFVKSREQAVVVPFGLNGTTTEQAAMFYRESCCGAAGGWWETFLVQEENAANSAVAWE